MKEYKIVQHVWVDHQGKTHSGKTHYTIIYKARFLFWSYWKTVKHEVCYESGCFYTPTEFSTPDDAKHYAEQYLCKGIKTNTWVEKTIIIC